MFLKAVFSGRWASDPSKKEDPLKKRRLAQLPGCKPDPTNWRWLKKSWLGKAKGKECKWQNLWKKGCFVYAGVGPPNPLKKFFCDLVLARDLVLLYLQDLHPKKISISKGFGFTIPSGLASPKKNPVVRDLVLLYLQDLHPKKIHWKNGKGIDFILSLKYLSKKNPLEKWKGNIFLFYLLNIYQKKSIGKMEREYVFILSLCYF